MKKLCFVFISAEWEQLELSTLAGTVVFSVSFIQGEG